MLRWTLVFLTIALVIGTFAFTDVYSSAVLGHIAKAYTILSVTIAILVTIWALTTKFSLTDSIDDVWNEEQRIEHLTVKLAEANKRSQFWEGKFRTVKQENNRIRRYNHQIGEDLGEASNRLADVINQASTDQKRYEAEIAELKELNRLLQHVDAKPSHVEIQV